MDPCLCHDPAGADGPGGPGAAAVARDDPPCPGLNPIPAEFRSRPLTKARAGALLGLDGGGKSRTRGINMLIRVGKVRCYELHRQKGIYDARDFPASALPRLLPDPAPAGPSR